MSEADNCAPAQPFLSRGDLEKIVSPEELPLLDAADKFANSVVFGVEGADEVDSMLRLAMLALIRNAFIAGASWGGKNRGLQEKLKALPAEGSA